MNRPDDPTALRGLVCSITVRPRVETKRYLRRVRAKVRVEAVADAGIYVHDGWDYKRGFRDLDFLHWDDVEEIHPLQYQAPKWNDTGTAVL